MTPTRRSVLATAGAGITISLAGCTASADGDEPDEDDITVSGLGASDVYHDAAVARVTVIGRLLSGDYILQLRYDGDADYDPADHDVLLMDGHDAVAEAKRPSLSGVDNALDFDLGADYVYDGATYRVVSKDPAGVVDEFDLTIHVDGDAS